MSIDINHFGNDFPIEYDKDKTGKNQKKIKDGTGAKKQKKPDHSQRTVAYWEKLGYRCDKLESWQNVNGMWVRKDFCGFADFLATKKGEVPVLIQTCAKNAVGNHLRKMLGDDVVKGGESRRSAFNYYFSLGWIVGILHFDQPGGFGSAWLTEWEPITLETIALVDSRRNTRRIKK